jgi:hypothetical protein
LKKSHTLIHTPKHNEKTGGQNKHSNHLLKLNKLEPADGVEPPTY